MREFYIGNRKIGQDTPCFIIAEAASNHAKDFNNALKLIDIAVAAGADAVKFQLFQGAKIASKTRDPIAFINENKTLYELLSSLEMPRDWLVKLKEYCKSKDIIFLCTPFDFEAVDLLDKLHIEAFKTASFEIIDLEFLRYIAKKGKPMIVSTGLASIGEIEEAVKAIRETENEFLAVLHCGQSYPMKINEVNLKVMETIKTAFNVWTGYSDHTLTISVPVTAVALGAKVIEKHFTFDKSISLPDNKISLSPNELKRMIKEIRECEAALGSSVKSLQKSEELLYQRARRSIFAAKNINKGEVIRRDMLAVLRPGIGLHPRYLNIIIGRKSQRNISENEPLNWSDI